MKFMKHWKVILAVVLVFAAGVVTGSVGMSLHIKRSFERGFKPENWTADAMKDMQKELKLAPDQQPKIRAILENTANHCAGSFGLAIRESATNIVDSWTQIEKELTPEQRVKFQQKCQKFREELKKGLKLELPPEQKV